MKEEALLPQARALRNRLVHSNDVMNLSSADRCDFLVTRDGLMKRFATSSKPQVVTPEELVTRLRALRASEPSKVQQLIAIVELSRGRKKDSA